jgi:predicted alpha-1,2-mannosidase
MLYLILFLTSFFSSCYATIYPMIGVASEGHTFPGATYPFGMIQLSPSNNVDDWKHASGYHYSDSTIAHFSHTHLSGTGLTDYDDVGLMPLGNPDDHDKLGTFNHNQEYARAGYYYVNLNDRNIDVELTATQRVGIHKYTWIRSKTDDNLKPTTVQVKLSTRPFNYNTQDYEISMKNLNNVDVLLGGYNIKRGWAGNRQVYFAIVCDHNFTYDQSRLTVNNYYPNTPVMFKVAISSVSNSNAYLNLQSHSGWNFLSTVQETQNTWNNLLNIFQIHSNDNRDVFDTSIYHMCIHPNLFSDINGQHRGPDDQVYTTDFNYYTLLSTWDTFRSWGSLISLTQPNIYTDIMKSMLHFSQIKGHLPVWTLWDKEAEVMVAIHSITLLGIGKITGLYIDQPTLELELEKTLNKSFRQLDQFRDRGWIDATKHWQSTSEMLEDSYNFYVAGKLHSNPSLSKYYGDMGNRYQNVWDPEMKFFRGKDAQGAWTQFKDFSNWNGDYAESLPLDMVWFIPHNISDLIVLNGGLENTLNRLHNYFFVDTRRNDQGPDNTGVINHHAHGNENTHHAMYIFNRLNRYDLTVKTLKRIYPLYTDKVDGIPGNEDAGQISSWYVLSGLGFHPIDPTSGDFELGLPLFKEMNVTINNNVLKINKDCEEPQRVSFNNVLLNNYQINISIIKNGGDLRFYCDPIVEEKKVEVEVLV